MPEFDNLPCRDDDGHVLVVVESPKHSTIKFKYDPKTASFQFKRALQLGVAYPHDWGFIPSTCAEDGDSLDAMVIFETATATGIVIPSVPIGVVRLRQKEPKGKWVRNDRIMLVPADDPRFTDVDELSERTREELEQFFITCVEMTDKKVRIEGWRGAKEAKHLINAAARRYVGGK
jgi:inorganic pyrophosphatase